MEAESTDPSVSPRAADAEVAERPKRSRTSRTVSKRDDLNAKLDVIIGHVKASPLPSEYEVEARIRRDDEDARQAREEKSREAEHDRTQKALEAQHRRSQERTVTWFGLGILGLGALLSAGTLVFRPYSEAPWAPPVLTLIVGGLVGYVARGKSA